MGVENIITFDAHDPRVQNAIPLHGFETIQPAYQFIKNILRNAPDMKLDKDHLMVISPDEGGMGRAIYMANNLGVDMGMFYKRRDYSTIIDGRNPIVAHEFLGADVKGKDMIIIDDMISSGESMLEVAKLLKDREAYGKSERSLLEMAHKDMLCIAGLLEVMDSLTLLADTQERELQSDLSDISVKLKDKAIAIENRWNTFLNKNYEIRR